MKCESISFLGAFVCNCFHGLGGAAIALVVRDRAIKLFCTTAVKQTRPIQYTTTTDILFWAPNVKNGSGCVRLVREIAVFDRLPDPQHISN